ncbi:hypothetical protein [Mycoplasma sp. 1018B]|uniref:hypothetical protein n=1 Tax=Mycoplasma sp. 1018B TaxID=2967302 RepID=UPI00211BE7BB|nr:hypothetical protein [Mycoplasma sp. 1018B]UUM19374.1 hypothetical protein NPA14_00665 [Mycoplasma sp. 1018B]
MKKHKLLLSLALATASFSPIIFAVACNNDTNKIDDKSVAPPAEENPTTPPTEENPAPSPDITPSTSESELEKAKTNLQNSLTTTASNIILLDKFSLDDHKKTLTDAETTAKAELTKNDATVQSLNAQITALAQAYNKVKSDLENAQSLIEELKTSLEKAKEIQAAFGTNDSETKTKITQAIEKATLLTTAEKTTVDAIRQEKTSLFDAYFDAIFTKDFLTIGENVTDQLEVTETKEAQDGGSIKALLEKAVNEIKKSKKLDRTPYTFAYTYTTKEIILFTGNTSFSTGKKDSILKFKDNATVLQNNKQLANAIVPTFVNNRNQTRLSSFLNGAIIDNKLYLRFKTGTHHVSNSKADDKDYYVEFDLSQFETTTTATTESSN